MPVRYLSGLVHRSSRDATSAKCVSLDVGPRSLVASKYVIAALWILTHCAFAAQSNLAIIDAGVEQAEDAPFVTSDYKFLPGDFVYFRFDIAGFGVESQQGGDTRKISLTYEVVPQDSNGVSLTPPNTGEIKEDLNPEDKNWTPKRRSSFLIPSFVAAGDYRVHVAVKDSVSKAETVADFPFRIGGIQVKPSSSITVQNLRFLRKQDDREPLQVPAYGPGDTVYVRFEMTGFELGSEKQYHLAYGLTVLGPDGKPFIQQPQAAEIQANSFYPAQFLPGNLDLNTTKTTATGEYVIVLTVRDLLANKTYETKQAFSVER